MDAFSSSRVLEQRQDTSSMAGGGVGGQGLACMTLEEADGQEEGDDEAEESAE